MKRANPNQLELEFSKQSKNAVYACEMQFGKVFYCEGDSSKRKFVRVKPVNYLLNSTLITDVINRNKIFTVSLDKATLSILPGNTCVIPVLNKTGASKK